jgi:hypothetical protein
MKVCIKRYNDESFFARVFHDLPICCPAQNDIAGVGNLPARILLLSVIRYFRLPFQFNS